VLDECGIRTLLWNVSAEALFWNVAVESLCCTVTVETLCWSVGGVPPLPGYRPVTS
jgi:hypothetical protein